MKGATIKTRIFLLQCIDWLLLIAVFSSGIYFTLNSEFKLIAALGSLFGLGVVVSFGRWTYTETARLKQELKKIERESKK